MVMPDTARRYTAEEVLAFPGDGNRYELVDGELLVTPAPTQKHQLVIGRRGDRFKKRRLYQRRGVGAYWMVDPDAQLVEVWHLQDQRPEIVTDVARWRVTPDAPELTIELAQLFARLPG